MKRVACFLLAVTMVVSLLCIVVGCKGSSEDQPKPQDATSPPPIPSGGTPGGVQGGAKGPGGGGGGGTPTGVQAGSKGESGE